MVPSCTEIVTLSCADASGRTLLFVGKHSRYSHKREPWVFSAHDRCCWRWHWLLPRPACFTEPCGPFTEAVECRLSWVSITSTLLLIRRSWCRAYCPAARRKRRDLSGVTELSALMAARSRARIRSPAYGRSTNREIRFN